MVAAELVPARRARPAGGRLRPRGRRGARAVGVCDVSTLGKIDVQGPDAAAFLDRVYANTISTLPVGRVRYGLMLREDGFVMDDGTVARLGAERFLVTTTTAAAGEVMAHLEFCLQCLWPELDVQAVVGHRAVGAVRRRRTAVARAPERRAGAPVDNEALPVHGLRRGRGRAASRGGSSASRFSGELAYEVAVPARYGAALFALLVAAGARARRRPLRARGAERAPDREGPPDPRRAARPDDRRRPRARADGAQRRTASARRGRRGRGSPGRSASSWWACGRSTGGRLLAGRIVLAPGAAFTRGERPGLSDLGAASRRRSGTTSRSASW